MTAGSCTSKTPVVCTSLPTPYSPRSTSRAVTFRSGGLDRTLAGSLTVTSLGKNAGDKKPRLRGLEGLPSCVLTPPPCLSRGLTHA